MSKKNIKKARRPRYPWPTDPEWWRDKPTGEIAAIMGCHRNAVYIHRTAHGYPSPPQDGGPGAPQRIRDDQINLNVSAQVNAEFLGCGVGWMKVRMQRLRDRGALPSTAVKRGRAVKKKKGRAKKQTDDWA